ALHEKTPTQTELQKSIGNVKLMCELLLENATEEKETSSASDHRKQSVSDEEMIQMLQQAPEVTDEEYNVMMGKDSSDSPVRDVRRKHQSPEKSRTDHDDANGESIFDF